MSSKGCRRGALDWYMPLRCKYKRTRSREPCQHSQGYGRSFWCGDTRQDAAPVLVRDWKCAFQLAGGAAARVDLEDPASCPTRAIISPRRWRGSAGAVSVRGCGNDGVRQLDGRSGILVYLEDLASHHGRAEEPPVRRRQDARQVCGTSTGKVVSVSLVKVPVCGSISKTWPANTGGQ